jgi:hypothetical protein
MCLTNVVAQGPLMAVIDAILEADRRAPRKQRHTGHRIWRRIRGRSIGDTALGVRDGNR